MPAIAWYVLQMVIIRVQGSEVRLWRERLATTSKAKFRPFLYIAGTLLAFVDTRISDAIYVVVALMWLVPDRRVEDAAES